jgi:hypothetical protein
LGGACGGGCCGEEAVFEEGEAAVGRDEGEGFVAGPALEPVTGDETAWGYGIGYSPDARMEGEIGEDVWVCE